MEWSEDLTRLSALAAGYRDGLLQDTLPFWLRHAPDSERGGYWTCLDADGRLVDTDKAMWQQGRFAWLLAKLYNTVEQNPLWLETCTLGIEFIERFATDPADGRMWFHVTQEGRPVRKRRYAFSESFASIAFAQYAKALGDERYARKAIELFERFLEHHLQPDPQLRKFEDERSSQGIGFPMITMATAQELRDAIDYSDAKRWIDFGVQQIRDHFVNEEHQAVLELVGQRGGIIDHFDGRTLNPGHAIEAAWFILWEGKQRDEADLIQLGSKMLRWMWRRGWDSEYGGLKYFVDLHDGPVQEYWHDMKFWWPHNEAIIATLLAYLLTNDSEFLSMHTQVHDWSFEHFPDRMHGEWFGYLHRDGTPSSTLKGNLWKGPFHLPRMQYMGWQLIQLLRPQVTA